MNEFHAIAYRYHRRFYSFLEHKKELLFHLLLTITFGVFFVLVTIYYIYSAFSAENGKIEYSFTVMLIMLGLSEIPFLLFYSRLKNKRNKIVASTRNSKDLTAFLDQAKIKWLNKEFNTNEYSYTKLVEKIRFIRKEAASNKSIFEFKFKDLQTLIFDPSSKARIVSFFIFLVSLCALISIKSINDSEVLFSIYDQLFNSTGALLLTITSVMFFVVMLVTVFSISIVLNSLSVISVLIDKERTQSDRIASILVKDMLKYSRLSLNKDQQDFTFRPTLQSRKGMMLR